MAKTANKDHLVTAYNHLFESKVSIVTFYYQNIILDILFPKRSFKCIYLQNMLTFFHLYFFLTIIINGLSNLAWLICNMAGCFDILKGNRFLRTLKSYKSKVSCISLMYLNSWLDLG